MIIYVTYKNPRFFRTIRTRDIVLLELLAFLIGETLTSEYKTIRKIDTGIMDYLYSSLDMTDKCIFNDILDELASNYIKLLESEEIKAVLENPYGYDAYRYQLSGEFSVIGLTV